VSLAWEEEEVETLGQPTIEAVWEAVHFHYHLTYEAVAVAVVHPSILVHLDKQGVLVLKVLHPTYLRLYSPRPLSSSSALEP
jgi:hypothetical protein